MAVRESREAAPVRGWAWLPWTAAVVVGVYAVVGPSGYLDYRELRAERERLEARIAELEANNRHLHEQIERLRNDDAYLERLARERLGMVKPNERVVIVPAEGR